CGSDPQLRGGGVIAAAAVDRTVALQQHEHQQLQVALAQRAEALQLGLAQEFGGEAGRVFEFELLHGSSSCGVAVSARAVAWAVTRCPAIRPAATLQDGMKAAAGTATSRPDAGLWHRVPSAAGRVTPR